MNTKRKMDIRRNSTMSILCQTTRPRSGGQVGTEDLDRSLHMRTLVRPHGHHELQLTQQTQTYTHLPPTHHLHTPLTHTAPLIPQLHTCLTPSHHNHTYYQSWLLVR